MSGRGKSDNGLARRGGGIIFEDSTRGALKDFLKSVIHDAVICCEHAKSKTVTAMDVVYALECQGSTLHGFGGQAVQNNPVFGPAAST